MSAAQALLAALLQSLWQVALIGLLAAALLAALRNAGPALRHAAGMVSLVTMLLIPLITFVDCLRGGAQPLLAVSLILIRLPAALTQALQGWAPGLWMAGACTLLLTHAGGLAWLHRLERRSIPLAPLWQSRLDVLRRRLGVKRAVSGRSADGLAEPFTARLFKPVIWLPSSLLSGLPVDQLEALLAHELAHIRRLDWLCNGIQCLAEALLFFHPAVWWLSREVRAQRELACDELALAAGVDPLVLAQALAGAARRRAALPTLALAAGGGELKRRIAWLLTGSAPRGGWRAPVLLVLMLLVSMVIGRVGGIAPWRVLLPPAPPAAPAPPLPPTPPLAPEAPDHRLERVR